MKGVVLLKGLLLFALSAAPGPTPAPPVSPPAPSVPAPAAAPAAQVAPAGLKAAPSPAAPGVDPLAGDPVASPESEQEPSLGATAIRMLVALGLVMAVIYVTLNYGLRRFMGARALPGSQGIVSVVERIPLDAKRGLLVIRAAGDYLLVGTGDAGMTLISRLDTEAVERVRKQRTPVGAVMSPFFKKLLARAGPKPPAQAAAEPPPASPAAADPFKESLK